MAKEIPLTKGKVALVSDEDYERVSQYKWYASLESRGTKWYAVRRETVNGKRVKIRMHRFVVGLGPGKDDPRVVDHKDHDSLNNTRENLEVIDQVENMHRSPGWKGSREWKRKRSFEVTQVVAREGAMDSQGEIFEDGALRFDKPTVPVYLHNNLTQAPIGEAELKRVGSEIHAKIRIFPTDLPLEALKTLKPSVSGWVKQRDQEDPNVIVTAYVERVSLDFDVADRKTKTLGDSI